MLTNEIVQNQYSCFRKSISHNILIMNDQLFFKQKYQVLERIGSGKMGIIYKVKKRSEYLSLGQDEIYASKHLSLHRIDLQTATKELKILEQLKHMHIVRYIENFVEDNELIIIMEYCGEKDLHFHIEKMKNMKKHFNENLVSTWIFQLILVIDYIHSKNVIHRDLKPQNVFIDKEMNLKIGDFGVSKLLQGSQNSKTFAGTPLYISPQLSRNEKYSKKTDIWSLGCVIYEICTLEKPFSPKEGFVQLIKFIQTTEPKNIPSFYSENINKLVKKMLTKEAKNRPTARQLLRDKILVDMMINYSSKVNLKKEYQGKPIEKNDISESFIEKQSNAVNSQLKKFEDQVKKKMFAFKNKKVHPNEVDRQYLEVQKKLKQIENVVKIAFEEMRSRNENEDNGGMMTKTMKMSALEESDQTIQSVELGSRIKQSSKLGESSIDQVQSVFIQSKRSKGEKTTKNVSEEESFDKTLQSQYLNTVQQNPKELAIQTLNKLEQIEKFIIDKPEIIMDETFMNYTLSMSNDINFQSFKTMRKMQDSLNFDFTKKQNEELIKPIPENAGEDSLEEYEADFEQFEEDREMDIRQQEKKAVKELFAETLKTISVKNDSQTITSPEGFKHKYALTLSQIKEHSNEGSMVSRNGEID